MFVDEAKIFVKAGNGGNGCRSFERIRGKVYGRPSGGSGGSGGAVIIKADNNKQTLIDYRYNKHFKAENGKHGSSNHKNGKRGRDSVLEVPPGTIIKEQGSGLLLRDLRESGDSVVIAKGGAGGRGNSVGHDATQGKPGEGRELLLELKIVADVGIIGYPNAGKSTLLSKLTDAKPKIAGFPFTTKEPNLGVVKYYDSSFVVCDIPGLIEGAHGGRGLGDRFLRHIERTEILLHVVDISGFDGRDPLVSYDKLNDELRLYSRKLASKPQIVAANKSDLTGFRRNIDGFRRHVKENLVEISSITGDGLGELKELLKRYLDDRPGEGRK